MSGKTLREAVRSNFFQLGLNSSFSFMKLLVICQVEEVEVLEDVDRRLL